MDNGDEEVEVDSDRSDDKEKCKTVFAAFQGLSPVSVTPPLGLISPMQLTKSLKKIYSYLGFLTILF